MRARRVPRMASVCLRGILYRRSQTAEIRLLRYSCNVPAELFSSLCRVIRYIVKHRQVGNLGTEYWTVLRYVVPSSRALPERTTSTVCASQTQLEVLPRILREFSEWLLVDGKVKYFATTRSHPGVLPVHPGPTRGGADGAVPRGPGLKRGARTRQGPHSLGRPKIWVIKCPTAMY